MSDIKVLQSIDTFIEDAEGRLGRANGNMYCRIPGIQNVHDGQILVRLKKKRFVVLDYSIVPSTDDISAASMHQHIQCPNGAGKVKCATPTCPKVGVPVMLYDSDPDEPVPLYLRSGLCFTCQRNLNEKRRTQRKRKGEEDDDILRSGSTTNPPPLASANSRAPTTQKSRVETDYKRFKLNDNILDLNPDAIIINGPLEGTRRHREPGYDYSDIALDLQGCLQEVASDLQQLLLISSSETPATVPVERNSDIIRSYEKTFLSLSKTIFLVNQWKGSWDAIFHRDNANAADDHSSFYGRAIADAVANAAAAAVAQSEQDIANNMIPIMMESSKVQAVGSSGGTDELGVEEV